MAAPILRQMRIDERDKPSPSEAAKMGLEPERDAAMSLVIECWQTLASDRPRELVPFAKGFATIKGEIQFDSIDRWARRVGLDDEDTLLIAAVIRRLDADRTERIHNELAAKG